MGQKSDNKEAEKLLRVFRRSNKSFQKALGDGGSQSLSKLGGAKGNNNTQGLLNQSKAKRDILLDFIRARLKQIKQVQQLELRSLKDQPEWWRQVGRRKSGFKLPDPTRWRQSAQLYQQAAKAACGGNLGKAAELLERATAEEKKAMKDVPKQVQVPSQLSAPTGMPDALVGTLDGEGCPVTTAPDIEAHAEEITRTSESPDAVAVPYLLQPHHHWWEAPEEDPQDPNKKPAHQAARAQAIEAQAALRDAESGRLPEKPGEKAEPEKEAPTLDFQPVRSVQVAPSPSSPKSPRKKQL